MDKLIEQASTYAADVDNLILLVTVFVGVWFLAAEAVFFWFILKFRAKDGVRAEYLDGSNPKHKRWITIPHLLVLVCDVFIIVGAIRVWKLIKMDMPPKEASIRIDAQQWAWSFQHPGKDGAFDTADDISTGNDMHVEVGKTYHFELRSKDVLHSFSVPVFRLKQDIIPGRVITGWFKADKTGEWDIQCTEMCGIGHGIMGGRIHVESAEQHAAWVASNTPVAIAAVAPAADPALALPAEGAVPVEGAAPADGAVPAASPADAGTAPPAVPSSTSHP